MLQTLARTSLIAIALLACSAHAPVKSATAPAKAADEGASAPKAATEPATKAHASPATNESTPVATRAEEGQALSDDCVDERNCTARFQLCMQRCQERNYSKPEQTQDCSRKCRERNCPRLACDARRDPSASNLCGGAEHSVELKMDTETQETPTGIRLVLDSLVEEVPDESARQLSAVVRAIRDGNEVGLLLDGFDRSLHLVPLLRLCYQLDVATASGITLRIFEPAP